MISIAPFDDVRCPVMVSADGSRPPAGNVGALWHFADCYVSLHRKEGFGLTTVDVLAAGRPAIATWYGGVTDYGSEPCGRACRQRLIDRGRPV